MKAKLVLHIGISKTGSSLLQGLLKLDALRPALEREGLAFSQLGYAIWDDILTIDPGDEDIQQLRLGDQIAAGTFAISPEMCDRFRTYIAALDVAPGAGYVASQEGLADMYLYLSQHGHEQQLSALMGVLGEFFDVDIVAMVRRQDHFAESFYAHSVKRGYRGDFKEFIATFPCERMHWDRLIGYFADVLSAGKVSILPFEKHLLKSAGFENIADPFMKACGITAEIAYGDLPVTNPSIAPFAIPIALHANRTLAPMQAMQLNEAMAQGCAKPPGSAFEFFDEDDRSAFLAAYADSNRRLFDSYMPNMSGDYYLSSA